MNELESFANAVTLAREQYERSGIRVVQSLMRYSTERDIRLMLRANEEMAEHLTRITYKGEI